ncbi:anti-anti-sigma regulatory factor [Spinactinospora alkalitolerans]|uniref:Anti-anti-sigma regulatory factor n=1 Tax=Spinactinospora alkalitolerans TaxID=687207 RepID=A0A852TYN7_9ACTN|nr:STAS domain-containing protein [Spinactinospora alkalitolerans]NYE48407.1 anti-anti-sigma regulatory factor [Spinactinospora alkalitolerans]
MKQQTQIIAKVAHIGRGVIVTFPQSIEERHGRCLREQLLWLLNERIDELAVDFSRTIFCDPSVVDVVERVYARSRAMGIRLSFVAAADSPAARVLHESGLTRVLHTYATREQAEHELAGASRARSAEERTPGNVPAPRDHWTVPLAS